MNFFNFFKKIKLSSKEKEELEAYERKMYIENRRKQIEEQYR